jgi:signal transduction histidine kinase
MLNIGMGEILNKQLDFGFQKNISFYLLDQKGNCLFYNLNAGDTTDESSLKKTIHTFPFHNSIKEIINSGFSEIVKEKHDLIKETEKFIISFSYIEYSALYSISVENKLKRNELDKSFEDIVYSAAHDLKGPIANMKLMVPLIKRAELKSDRDKLLDSAEVSVIRLENTLNSLVTVAQVNSAEEFQPEMVNLKTAVQLVLEELDSLIKTSGSEINASIPENESVFFDRNWLSFIIKNGIENGIKFQQPENRPVIDISVLSSPDKCTMIIKDNGVGFDLEKYRMKLFKPFSKFTSKNSGAGIGLYVSKLLLGKSNGGIEVDSEPGKGTKLILTFSK